MFLNIPLHVKEVQEVKVKFSKLVIFKIQYIGSFWYLSSLEQDTHLDEFGNLWLGHRKIVMNGFFGRGNLVGF